MQKFMKLILIAILLIQIISAQDQEIETNSGTRIGGIGLGVFIIIMGFALSFCICMVSGATTKPELVSLGGLFIPIILIIIFAASPKEFERQQEQQQEFVNDESAPVRIVFFIFILIGFLISVLWQMFHYLFEDKQTRTPSNWKTSKEEKRIRKLAQQQQMLAQQEEEKQQQLQD